MFFLKQTKQSCPGRQKWARPPMRRGLWPVAWSPRGSRPVFEEPVIWESHSWWSRACFIKPIEKISCRQSIVVLCIQSKSQTPWLCPTSSVPMPTKGGNSVWKIVWTYTSLQFSVLICRDCFTKSVACFYSLRVTQISKRQKCVAFTGTAKIISDNEKWAEIRTATPILSQAKYQCKT